MSDDRKINLISYIYIWGRVITGSQDLNMRRVCKVQCAYIHISEESY